jgi:hypothetical protein
MTKRNTGQSILEYAILLGVIIAALLIMQFFVKRAFQGNLKESADKMGDQFSANNTTTSQVREMSTNQNIVSGVATTALVDQFGSSEGSQVELPKAELAVANDVYSYNQRTGGKSKSTSQSLTDSAAKETTRYSDYKTNEVDDFTMEDKPAE